MQFLHITELWFSRAIERHVAQEHELAVSLIFLIHDNDNVQFRSLKYVEEELDSVTV